MFRPPLRYAFPITLMTVGGVVLLGLTSLDLWRTLRQVETDAIKQSMVLGAVIGSGIEAAYRRDQPQAAREVFSRANSDRSLALAVLVDDEAEVIFSTDFSYRGKRLEDTPLAWASSDVRRVLETRHQFSAIRGDGDTALGVFPVGLQPGILSFLSSRNGALVLTHRITAQKTSAIRTSLSYLALVGGGLFLIALVVWRTFDALLMVRVRRLIAFTDQTTADIPLDRDGNDEIARVSRAVADMAERLKDQNKQLVSSRQFVKAALDAVPANLAVIDSTGKIVSVNEAWRAFALQNEFADRQYGIGTNYLDVCDAAAAAGDDIANAVATSLRHILNGSRLEETFEYPCATDRGERTFSLQIRRFEYAGERLALTSHVDISASKKAAMDIEAAERRYRTLYNENPAMFFTIDKSLRIVSANDYGAAQLGYQASELVGASVSELYDADAHAVILDRLAECYASPGEVLRWEINKRRREGSVFRARETGRTCVDEHGVESVLLVCEDISEADALAKRLHHLATTDSLTGLINRYEFESQLTQLIRNARQESTEHVLAYIDLDQFKIINDTSGHVAGDELLRQMARVIKQRIRREDTLARLGGDEFGVIMAHCSVEQGVRVSRLLCEAAEDFRFVWDEQPFIIGASIGLAKIDASTRDVTEILRAADAACYAAKDAGRNRVRVYEPGDAGLAQRHGEMQWLSSVQQAMDNASIELFAQPIVACGATDGEAQAVHYEVLIRMRGDNGELHSPGAFLPAAERYDLAPKLDRWVVTRYFDWLSENPRHRARLSLGAINLSGHTIVSPAFADFVRTALQGTDIRPNQLCFEVTETAAIANLNGAVECIKGLRALGCQVALDDFGSGMASFGYLKALPVDYVKIDGMFVKDMLDDPVDAAMVRSINDIGHVLGKLTVAEFVESPEILKQLQAIGVDYAQGYALGQPRPISQFADRQAAATNVIMLSPRKEP